jgi:hypothetical protein
LPPREPAPIEDDRSQQRRYEGPTVVPALLRRLVAQRNLIRGIAR